MQGRLTSWLMTGVIVMAADAGISRAADVCRIRDVTYNGWACKELTNGRIDVVIAPPLGGRIIQLRLGEIEYLWVNPELAGKVMPNGVIPAGGDQKGLGVWANYGGDKLWPAPQGWQGPNEWPGPPDPYEKGGIVDHGTYDFKVLTFSPHEGVQVELTSPPDRYAGIRFVREITLMVRTTVVEQRITMTNISDKPVRWGIWEVMQHGGHTVTRGSPLVWDKARIDVQAWAPVNEQSRFPRGYAVMFGPQDNPQFSVIEPTNRAADRRLFRLDYQYKVGKVGLDVVRGWLAVTHQTSEHLMVRTFSVAQGAAYPDNASVEFWTSGLGRIRVGDKDVDMSDREPVLIESEVLSPFADLEPGKSHELRSDIHLCRGKGPVLSARPGYAVLDPIRADEEGRLRGRVCVSHDCILEVRASANDEYVRLGELRAGDVVDVGQLAEAAGTALPKLSAGRLGQADLGVRFRPLSPSGFQSPSAGKKPVAEVRAGQKGPSAKAVHIKANEFGAKVLKADKPAVVDFYADWCGPCRRLAPTLEELAEELAGKAYVFKVNVDEAKSLAAKYGVQGIPTVIVFNKGNPVQTLVGVKKKREYLSAVGKVTGAE